MGSEKCHAVTGLPCARDFPAGDGGESRGRDGGRGGAGHRTAALATSHGLRTADAVAREAEWERLDERREALAAELTEHWGEPFHLGLQTLLLRTAAEEVPEPWARLSHLVGDAYVWQAPECGCWIVLGVADRDPADEIRLLLTVTATGPP
ncbi:hypothetical protein ACL02U_18185 [Streptomyces sp. MS06]|uniref:hypothetical protein n=1 Tax=Streptomyces sp. MS06 TaxID=3385974 RepID=UPI0039A28E79